MIGAALREYATPRLAFRAIYARLESAPYDMPCRAAYELPRLHVISFTHARVIGATDGHGEGGE